MSAAQRMTVTEAIHERPQSRVLIEGRLLANNNGALLIDTGAKSVDMQRAIQLPEEIKERIAKRKVPYRVPARPNKSSRE